MAPPDRRRYDQADGTNPLHILRHAVRRGGSLEQKLKTSLAQAQQIQIEAAGKSELNVFVFGHNNEGHRTAVTEAFMQKQAHRRKTAPVVLFDIPKIEEEKGSPANLGDLLRGYEIATLNIADQVADGDGNYPLLTVDRYLSYAENEELGGGFMTYGNFDNHFHSNQLSLAVIYPAQHQVETQTLLFSMVNVADRKIDVLADQAVIDQATHDYMSPWITKLRFDQLMDLSPQRLEALLDTTGEVIDPTRTDRVRYLEADYGSGKTTMLKALMDMGISDVTYWLDAQPLVEQQNLLTGKVIVVDEAIGRTPEELKEVVAAAERNGGTVIMCVQNADFREEVAARIVA